jgi:hypothetical protein
VLVSTLTHKTLACGRSVADVSLGLITLPTLVVAHRDDACACTPSVDASAVIARLTGTLTKEALYFSGGDPPLSAPCDARSQHGFFGIEATVVAAIANWINTH